VYLSPTVIINGLEYNSIWYGVCKLLLHGKVVVLIIQYIKLSSFHNLGL
jgi:hypothetical protein